MLTDGRTDGRTTDGRTTDGRTTDARVTGILIAHLGAFGSGELKSEEDIVIASVRPSVMLSPPKPLDQIQPNLVCELPT